MSLLAPLAPNTLITKTELLLPVPGGPSISSMNGDMMVRFMSTRSRTTKLRTHAVSILDGNYDDFEEQYSSMNKSGNSTKYIRGEEEDPFSTHTDDDDDGWTTASTSSVRKGNKVLWDNYDDEETFGDYSTYYASDGDYTSHEEAQSTTTTNTTPAPKSLYDVKLPDDEIQRQRVLAEHQAEMAQREKWIQNARPPVRVQELDAHGRAYGRGGRKTSTARVWIRPGLGMVTINKREFLDYFPRMSDRELILSPFVATRTCGKFDMICMVDGGGVTGKAGAIRHGLARALEKYDPNYRPPLKRLGYITRDPRKVERKKVGLKKARKAPQWVRR